MIGHFPDPYPGELLYSVLARFGNRFDFPTTKQVGESAFGKTTATAVVDFPAALLSLTSAVPAFMNIDVDRLIDRNTVWPFFAAFQSFDRRQATRAAMKKGGHPYLKFGLMATQGPLSGTCGIALCALATIARSSRKPIGIAHISCLESKCATAMRYCSLRVLSRAETEETVISTTQPIQ